MKASPVLLTDVEFLPCERWEKSTLGYIDVPVH